MKNFKKKELNSSNGITLIALVITIIVLLILAGISISMLSGDNSILQKATDAKERTGVAEVVENAKLDILAQIAENKGENISKAQLKAILNIYFDNINNLELPDDLSNSDIKLNANQQNGGYKDIALVDIYNGKFVQGDTKTDLEKLQEYFSKGPSKFWNDSKNTYQDVENVDVDSSKIHDKYQGQFLLAEYNNNLYAVDYSTFEVLYIADLNTFGEKEIVEGRKVLIIPNEVYTMYDTFTYATFANINSEKTGYKTYDGDGNITGYYDESGNVLEMKGNTGSSNLWIVTADNLIHNTGYNSGTYTDENGHDFEGYSVYDFDGYKRYYDTTGTPVKVEIMSE